MASPSPSSCSLLSPGASVHVEDLLRGGLCDRNTSKRRAAALLLERRVRSWLSCPSTVRPRVSALVQPLLAELLASSNDNMKKGGLIASAAIVVALKKNATVCADKVLPTVLSLLSDSDTQVRFYACESAYNIIKVVRSYAAPFFPIVLDSLCQLISDADTLVRNSAELLSALLKDVAMDSLPCPAMALLPVLSLRIRSQDPFVVHIVLTWIMTLLQRLRNMTDVDQVLLQFTLRLLPSLLIALENPHRDIRLAAHQTLLSLWTSLPRSASAHARVAALVAHQANEACQGDHRLGSDRQENSECVGLRTALNWLGAIVNENLLLPEALSDLLPVAAAATMAALREVPNSPSLLHRTASSVHTILLSRTKTSLDQNLILHRNCVQTSLLRTLEYVLTESTRPFSEEFRSCSSGDVASDASRRKAALQWLDVLLPRLEYVAEAMRTRPALASALMDTLVDPAMDIVAIAVKILSRSVNGDDSLNPVSLTSVFSMMRQRNVLIRWRGPEILSLFCRHLDARNVYSSVAVAIQQEHDHGLGSSLVHSLHMALMTSDDLANLRDYFDQCLESVHGSNFFAGLFAAWSLNPVEALGLCLLAHADELASLLVMEFISIEASAELLEHVLQLIGLLESPVFIRVRLRLATPHQCPFLVRALYGVLALVPQTAACRSLQARLRALQPLALIGRSKNDLSTISRPRCHLNLNELMQQFRQAQEQGDVHLDDANGSGSSEEKTISNPSPPRSSCD